MERLRALSDQNLRLDLASREGRKGIKQTGETTSEQ